MRTRRWRSTACSTRAPRSSRSRSRPTGWRARCARCWTGDPPPRRSHAAPRPGWLAAAALALAGVGMSFLTAPDAGGLNRGDLLTLTCALCFGGQIVVVSELSRHSDARRLVWMQIAGTALVAAVAAALFERPRVDSTPTFPAAPAWTVVFASTLSFVLHAAAQRHMSPARAALRFCFGPLFSAAASWLVVGERLSLTQWAGGALIVGGMALADLPWKTSGATDPVEVRSRKPDISPDADV